MIPMRNIAGLALLAAHFAVQAIKTRAPQPISLTERLQRIPARHAPVSHAVTIHWSEHQIPFIEAAADTDLAAALGIVHAHLRTSQMEILRRLSQGRLSEMIGPVALDLDQLLRILDFGRAIPEIIASMPEETRAWLEAFVKGINHYLCQSNVLPHEFPILNLKREFWSISDVIRIGRLAAADVNWLVWFQLLKLREQKEWPRLWQRLTETGATSPAAFLGSSRVQSLLLEALGYSARWASNSVAVSASRSMAGGALIASDPHLAIHLPNPWLIAGFKSPTHHAVGLMAPGLPFIALGRNPWIAWGGTNLHAASSDFFGANDLSQDDIFERCDVIKVRWWPDQEIVLRDAPLGPIISDARLLGLNRDKPIALHWMGHLPSDEFTAMLKVNKAHNWDDFRSAIDGISVPGQTMTYADAKGHVGKAMGVRLPNRKQWQLRDLTLDPSRITDWHSLVTGTELRTEYDPMLGSVVSANEKPNKTAVPVGYFFSPPDRAHRLNELIGMHNRLTSESLKVMLQDVYIITSHDICAHFVELFKTKGAQPINDTVVYLEQLLAAWDGQYEASSKGALAFELVFQNFVREYYAKNALFAFWSTWMPRTLVRNDLLRADSTVVTSILKRAIRRAVRPFERFKVWGNMHRLKLAHPFGHVPIFGKRYVFRDMPAAGGGESINKTGHRLSMKRHEAIYGSNARHISDLSDLDRNYFILLGGQDGWVNSANYMDQTHLWQQGEYIQVPLRSESVRSLFPHRMTLVP